MFCFKNEKSMPPNSTGNLRTTWTHLLDWTQIKFWLKNISVKPTNIESEFVLNFNWFRMIFCPGMLWLLIGFFVLFVSNMSMSATVLSYCVISYRDNVILIRILQNKEYFWYLWMYQIFAKEDFIIGHLMVSWYVWNCHGILHIWWATLEDQ